MSEEAAVGEESDLSDFEIDDEIKHELNSLMNLEFIQTSSDDDDADEEKEEVEKEPEKEEERQPRGDSLERELEMMFMSQHVKEVPGEGEEGASKDTGLESISDNELDGPESGECDTSDGELPDSPSIVVTVPDTPPINHVQGVEDLSGSSDVELVEDYQGREYYEQPQKSAREVIIESRESVPKKKEKSPSKSKDKSAEKVKKDKKDKSKKKIDSEGADDEKRRMKLEKYMARLEMYKAKCRDYMKQITKKYDYMKKNDKTKIKVEKGKIKNISVGEGSKLKSIVKEVNRDVSPESSTSSKFDRSSHSSKADKSSYLPVSDDHGKRSSSEKERKSKHKKSKSKSKEFKEHKLLYQEYLQYLQLEREKCLEEGIAIVEKPKKLKKRKSKSKSPDKRKEIPVSEKKASRPPILSFSEFCNNRELVSPDRETTQPTNKVKTSHDAEARKERTISIDSAATTATVRSDPVDPTDDDKELFITITDLEQQDKQRDEKRSLEQDKEKIETELEKDPELKSISVFTSVLFKGGADSEGIPFLSSECRPTSPKPADVKPRKPFIQDTGIDEIYDMNDDLSNISQSSLSPSRSPVPKLHNKSLLNYLENQKERLRKKSPDKNSKGSRSRSKSPRRERSKSKKRKRKHHSSISTVSPSPPPLRPRSPETSYRKRPSPPAYLKERWKDYPSPPELRLTKREHRLPILARRRSRSRTRKVHRSRSSSEERERHYRRYRSRSRSRSRSPPVLTMVQLTAAEKRRKLREDHERALASLRETIRKPLSNTPLSITITNHGDNFETITDNYDPVVMNEDSSSNSLSEVEVMTEPSLPPLPPEPPPPTPAPPSAEKRDDLTVVTTYTSFVPLPNTNMVHPPMGYDVPIPSFGNWMPPVTDMQHPNVMFPPPQMMSNYSTPPPQQHFPFMNQPPPPLPYQMTMPPPCHQHYRMPTQAPPGVNIVSVRQEVKNLKSNPIIITQISDEDEHQIHPLEGSKCKHNPLGQNNQTIQEAIDSVKKCLKNCDALKNKDPRLALVDGRKKSPERSELSSKFDDRKVKITLNFKPRPVSDVEQTCVFEPANDESDCQSSGLSESNKPADDNYTEKSSKIEGIVSKLKDNISTSTGLLLEKSIENKSLGDEPYDPFNVSDEINDSYENTEELKTSSSDKPNDRIHTVVLQDSTPKLSESEVENINDQINKSFAFILSHSIERKRLTPTLPSIVAKKAEKQMKSGLNEKMSPISKACQLNQDIQGTKNNNTDLNPLIKPSHLPPAEESAHKSETIINNASYSTSKSVSKANINKSQEKLKNSPISSKLEKSNLKTSDSDKPAEIVLDKSPQMKLEKLTKMTTETHKLLSETEAFNLSYNRKCDNLRESDSKTCINEIPIQNDTVQSKPSDKDITVCKPKRYIDNNNEKSKNLFNSTQENNIGASNTFCKESNIHNKEKDDQFENQSENSKSPLARRLSVEKQEDSLNNESNNLCNDTTQNASKKTPTSTDNKVNEYSFGINVDMLGKQDPKQLQGKTAFGESKNHFNLERRGNPPLSIPTKGELKRFPTPERSMPKTTKTESHLDTECDKSKLQKILSAKATDGRDNANEKQFEEKVAKSPSSNVVESILHDFDESNSVGCDFQPLGGDKTLNNANKTIIVSRTFSPGNGCDGSLGHTSDSKDLSSSLQSCLLTSNKIPSKIDIRDQVPTVNCKVTESETLKNWSHKNTCGLKISESKQHIDPSQKYNTSDEDVSSTAEHTNVSSTEKLLEEDVNVPHDESKEISQNCARLKEDDKIRIVRRSRRKAKLSKSNICNNGGHRLSNYDSTETKKNNVENDPFQNPLFEEDIYFNNQNKTLVRNIEKVNNVSKLQNFSSTYPAVLKFPKSNKNPFKPCPLSRKSKSYISQNLPLSFDLSVDGHLIRRGFKKLRVSLHRLVQQSTTARPSDIRTSSGVSSSCLNGANGDNDCYVDLVVESIASDIRNKESACDKQVNNEKPKKRVSFDLNVSEIFDDSKCSSDYEVSVNTRTVSEPNCKEPDDINYKNSKTMECYDDDLPLEASHNTVVEKSKADETDKSNTETSFSDCKVAVTVDKFRDEKQPNSLSSLYQEITKTLVSLRGSPLPHMPKRKTVVVYIPSPEEMPVVKVIDSPKKTSKSNTKKSDLRVTLEDVREQSSGIGTEEENVETEPCAAKNLNKNETSRKCCIETLKRKSCDPTEVHDSDNDESMILDRELSDLAKGCLDSDNNVGEDDDSVLNFGIAASDDSSLDSEFEFNCKNTFSKSSTRQKNKLSSPQNIKKRFVKKLRSVDVEVELNTNKNASSEMAKKDENKLSDRRSGQSQQNVVDNKTLLSKLSEHSTPTLESVSEKISLDKPIEETKDLFDSNEMEVPTLTKRKVYHTRISDSILSKVAKHSETLRRTSKRQKNKSIKSLINSEDDTEKTSEYEKNPYTNITSGKIANQNSENNVSIDLHLRKEDNKEMNLQSDFSNQDCENNTNKEEVISNNNVHSDIDKFEAVDYKKGSIPQNEEDFTVNSNDKADINLNIELQNTSENTCYPKTALKNKSENENICTVSKLNSTLKTDTIERKLSPIRKTRRGKLLELDASGQPQLLKSEDKTIQHLDTKSKGKANEISRKRRSGRLVDNDPLCSSEECLSSQGHVHSQEDTSLKNVDSEYPDEHQVKTPGGGVEVKESLTQRRTKNLLKNDHKILVSDNTCVEVDISKTTEALKESVTDKEECVDNSRKGNDKEDFSKDSEPIPFHNELSIDEPIQETEKITNYENQKKEVKKLEDVTSTTSEITSTESVRKTRLSQRKKSAVLNVNQLRKELNVDSVDSKFLKEISDSPVRITRSKKNICDGIEEENPKRSNDNENQKLSSESDKINFEIKKDELDIKNPHLVKRSLSTESSDEPLIFVKNKLLADKNEYINEETTSEYSESSESCKNNSSVLQNEDIKVKCKSSVSDGSANKGQGNVKESSVSNEGKNMQGTRSDGNESNSSNHSSNNSLSNTDNSNRSFLNVNGISNSNNTSNPPVGTFLNQNVLPPVNSQTIYSSLIRQKCSMNPKLKEAMRKKRDKAEVDAEIKRRLAEIDELEKLAKSQLLEKIGARTRSRAIDSSQNVNIDDEDDVVSISSDDSQGTSVGTNEATNTGSKMVDIGKSEDVNEEPTTTQEDVVKTCAPAQAEKDISPLGLLFKGSVSILPVDATHGTKTNKINEIESADIAKVENQTQRQTTNDINNISKLCVEKSLVNNKNKKDNLISEKSMINLPPHVANNVTLEVCKRPLDTDEIPTSHSELDATGPIREHLVKNKRDVVSVYQFRESEDESEQDEEIHTKQKYNRVSRRRAEIGKQKNKINTTSLPLKKSKQLQEKCIRKTRHGSIAHEIFTDKCEISSRESSPFNIITKTSCEISQQLNDQSDLTLSSNIVPEPDSSTSVIDTSCNHPGSVKTPTDVPKDSSTRSLTQGEEINSVVSSNNTPQESDMIPTSPVTGFKQPYRKSLVTRRRRKRRSYFGRCLIPSNNLENPDNESFGDNNDHTITQSEEVVSSSVSTVQIPQDKKKRRRRKTVMDLLMEDSMLSVTRDFPMSPNPYMFSSFYKDIDLPNPNSKPNLVNESTTIEQNVKKTGEDRGLPLKPDFLAQKLRILEKLKSISRKNRKTRQCRTLVCYNEDSLPESLVESPVGESVPNNGDGGMLSQDISAQISLVGNNGECSTKSFQETSINPDVELKIAVEGGCGDGSESLRKGQKYCLSKTPLKRGRKSKANKSVKKVNENDEWETQSETTTEFCIKENPPKESLSPSAVLETKDDDPTFENNQSKNNIELSEFDKLLESKPKDSSRIKVTYDYDPGSPRSPSEDKSDDAPDDFFNSLPSPRQSSDDESSVSENSNDNQYLSPQHTTGQNTCIVNDDNSIELQLMRPEKIVCSILKSKIGKMLPYFGDTSSEDDHDDDDLDEDIPLSIKFTQFNEEETKYFQPNVVKKYENFSNLEVFNSLPVSIPKRPAFKRRRKQITRLAPLSNIRLSGRSTRSKSATVGEEDIVTTAAWGEVSKKIDILDDSLDVNSESPVQIRKSNRKLKTTNFVCKETVDNIKQTFNEGQIDKQDSEINNDCNINNEKHLDPEDEQKMSLKRKGRPLKTKLVKENNIDKDTKKPNNLPVENVETEDQSNSESYTNLHFTRKKGNCSETEDDDNGLQPVESSTVNDIQDDDENSKSTINPKSQEQSKLQLSDLNSAIQKSISLRRTKAKRGKGSIDLETNVEEQNNIEKPENDCDDNPHEDCSLEDLPLNKRAARDIIPRKRGKKDTFSSDNIGHYSSRDNSVAKVEDSVEIREDSYSNNKDEINSSMGKCFNDSPPPLIRTRARRAKLITSENNDLDPPSLETSIPPNIDNDKNDFVSGVNTDSNLDSTDTLMSEDINLPPRKRGRKPKNAGARIQQKSDISEALFKTPNEIPVKEPNNSKTQESEEITLSKSNSMEIQSLPRRRGRRGKRKVIRRRTGHKFNTSNKDADSDDDSEVEINIPRILSNGNLPAEIDQQDELDSSITNMRKDERDLADNCSENTDFTMQEDGRKRKRKIRENKQEATGSNPNALIDVGNENNTESDDSGTKKSKNQGCDEIEDESRCEASASGTSNKEPHAFTALSCANQPFLWNKISAFLNKTTRSVGTQVKVKNMVLKGFETSEPEVSLQSELTLPQVIKTLFEELRFIDSSFSNP